MITLFENKGWEKLAISQSPVFQISGSHAIAIWFEKSLETSIPLSKG